MNEKNAVDLADFLHLESQNNDDSSSPLSAAANRRHALGQLIESTMGADLDKAVQQGQGHKADETAAVLMNSPSFKALQEVACGAAAMSTSPRSKDAGDVVQHGSASKKAKIPDAPPAPAPTSFSLFDMLDSQKGSMMIAPRITAHQVIEADTNCDQPRQQENGEYAADSETGKSAMQLLEQADDLEDLSPDSETWESIRKILYRGLLSKSDDESSRSLKTHQSLITLCGRDGGAMFSHQRWGLTFNLVTCLLELSERTGGKIRWEFYWDTTAAMLLSLSGIAREYVVSCVGREREIERMMLGLAMLLKSDIASGVLAAIDPFSGWFGVWARFMPPRKLQLIAATSGLGGAALERCEELEPCAKSRIMIEEMCQSLSNTDQEGGVSYDDVKHSMFIQSLSILHALVVQSCGSMELLSAMISDDISGSGMPASCSSFLISDDTVSVEAVRALLNKARDDYSASNFVADAKERIVRPFHDILRLKERNHESVGQQLGLLCTDTIHMLDY